MLFFHVKEKADFTMKQNRHSDSQIMEILKGEESGSAFLKNLHLLKFNNSTFTKQK